MGRILGDIPAVSQLCRPSPGCWGGYSSSAGALPAPLWAQGLGHARLLAKGPGWALWGAAGEGPPPTPPSHYQPTGHCLAPPSPPQPHHNLLLRDMSWRGESFEINPNDIPQTAGHGHKQHYLSGLGKRGHRSFLPRRRPQLPANASIGDGARSPSATPQPGRAKPFCRRARADAERG